MGEHGEKTTKVINLYIVKMKSIFLMVDDDWLIKIRCQIEWVSVGLIAAVNAFRINQNEFRLYSCLFGNEWLTRVSEMICFFCTDNKSSYRLLHK